MGSLRKTELSIKTKAINEPRHEKNMLFAYAKTKAQISCAVPLRAVNTLEKKMDHILPRSGEGEFTSTCRNLFLF